MSRWFRFRWWLRKRLRFCVLLRLVKGNWKAARLLHNAEKELLDWSMRETRSRVFALVNGSTTIRAPGSDVNPYSED